MNSLSHLTLAFEGRPLTTILFASGAGWPAHEIGRQLLYSHDGRRLVTAITVDWAGEFIEGHDFVRLTGAKLAEAKQLLGEDPTVSRFASELIVLLQPGLDLVLIKTHKDIGKRLRRFLVDEVFPRLRGGELAAEPKPEPMLDLRQLREVRLWRQADLADRKFRSAAVSSAGRWLHAMGRIDVDALVRFEAVATQIALCCAPAGVLPPPVGSADLTFVLAELDRVAA